MVIARSDLMEGKVRTEEEEEFEKIEKFIDSFLKKNYKGERIFIEIGEDMPPETKTFNRMKEKLKSSYENNGWKVSFRKSELTDGFYYFYIVLR